MILRAICIFLFLTLITAPARALDAPQCACTARSFDVRWASADAIFAGTVESVEPYAEFLPLKEADLPVVVTLSVDESYKGLKDEKTFVLHTSLTSHTCTGYPFEKGRQYLVFAYQRKDFSYAPQNLYRYPVGTYDTGGLCGGTKEFTAARDDLQAIKTAKPKKAGLFQNIFRD